MSPEFLACLDSEDWLLDLGSQGGSFSRALTRSKVIRVDLHTPVRNDPDFVRADAAHLPFPDHSIAAVVANHSLEHFTELDQCLAEIGRVMEHEGALYVAVPDASTLTDKLYRWLSKGGGHVNPFVDATALAQRVSAVTGLKFQHLDVLHSGFSFLNRKNTVTAPPFRIMLVGGGFEWTLKLGTYLFRQIDCLFGTRLSVYGWALYFGESAPGIARHRPETNVCVRCGSSHGATWLVIHECVNRSLLWRHYRCPACSTLNLFTSDET